MSYKLYNKRKLTNHFVKRFYERIYKNKIKGKVMQGHKKQVLHEINILINKPEVVSMMELFKEGIIKVKYKNCQIVIRNKHCISIIPKNEHLKKVYEKMPYSMTYRRRKKRMK